MSSLAPEISPPLTAPTRRRGLAGRVSHENLVLAVILTSQLMVVLDATIVNVALPKMQAALGFSPAGLSWVLNAYTLTFGGLLLLGARAGDLLGRRKTFVAGIVVFTFASLVGGFATSSGFLLAARALQGIGGALAAPSSLALLTTMFSDGKARMRALALFTAVSVSGGALGLILGGMLTQWASWRWVMFVNVPIGLVVVLAGRALLPETDPHPGRFDVLGALTSTLGMGLLVYGFVRAASDGWSDVWTVMSFVIGALLLAAFVAVELRAEEPITPLRLLADRSRTSANVARGLLFAGMFGMFFFLTQYLQDVLHYSSLKTGFAFLPMPTTVFLVSQLTSRSLSERVPGRVLMLGGVGLAATGFLLASGLGEHSSYLHVFGCLILFAIGNGMSFVPLTSAALAGVPQRDAGAASGLVNVTQQLGGALGVAVLVTVAGSATKHAGGTAVHAFLVGVTHAFAGSAVFLAAAFVLVAALVRSPKTTH
jgi:EmrB/QacA subfamily drug resistance transporter